MKRIIIIIISLNFLALYPCTAEAGKFIKKTESRTRKDKKKKKNIVWYNNCPSLGKVADLYVKY